MTPEQAALLESFARVLAKSSRYETERSIAAVIALDLKIELENYMSAEDINEFFNMFEAAKQWERRR